MVKGVEKFKEHFAGYEDSYILIGGAACDTVLSAAGLPYRSTKDLDIVLIAEAVTEKFIQKMWEFIKEGKYSSLEQNTEEKKFYRFTKPQNSSFPYQIELFSRKSDLLLDIPKEMRLTPIHAGEGVSSLSAILLDDAYYQLLLENSKMEDGLHLATTELLICLKAKAFLELKKQREKGETIDQKNIDKHIKDIVRLTLLLTDESRLILPSTISTDMQAFYEQITDYPVDYKSIGENMGVATLDRVIVLAQLHHTFD
jgi:hypothetical protein